MKSARHAEFCGPLPSRGSSITPALRHRRRWPEIVDGIAADRGITTVEQVTERWQLGKRTLQRLFDEYVGVWPRWVISRYRLHLAIERLCADGPADWAQLALELGYFDQAHFIRDFKALVGRPPAAYVRGR